MLAGLLNRTELELNASRDRNPNYVRLSDGSVRNGYTIKVVNKGNEPRVLDLVVEGDPALVVRVLGAPDEAPMQMRIEADRTRDFVVYLTLPHEAVDVAREDIMFRVVDPATGETAGTRSVLVTGMAE
jgi:polyferredoxin